MAANGLYANLCRVQSAAVTIEERLDELEVDATGGEFAFSEGKDCRGSVLTALGGRAAPRSLGKSFIMPH